LILPLAFVASTTKDPETRACVRQTLSQGNRQNSNRRGKYAKMFVIFQLISEYLQNGQPNRPNRRPEVGAVNASFLPRKPLEKQL